MAYRSIDENFWRSPRVRELSDSAKLAYLFLISNGRLSGVVHKTPEELAAGIGWPPKKWLAAVEELAKADRVSIGYPHLIWVRNHIDHQFLAGGKSISPKIVSAINKELSAIPDSNVIQQLKEKYKTILGYPIDRVSEVGVTVPVPEPVPVPESKYKDIPAQKEKAGLELEASPKPRSPNQRIQDGELEAARKEFAKRFGGPNGKGKITEAQLSRLAFGAGGDGRDCFETLPALTAFLASLKDKDCLEIEKPYAYLAQCARNPETVERAKKAVFAGPAGPRGVGIATVGQILAVKP